MIMAQQLSVPNLVAFIRMQMAEPSILFYTISGAHLYGFPSSVALPEDVPEETLQGVA
jgi:hypothetical protein